MPGYTILIMKRNATVGNILRNGWVQLAVQSPGTNEILLYQKGEFRPYHPEAAQLPAAAIKYVRRVEELIGAPVAILSTSPERDDTILVRDPFAA